MKKKRKILSLIIALAMLVTLTVVPAQAAAKVKSQSKSVTMVVDQKMSIRPSVKMTYKSSNPKVVSVTSKGTVTAKKKGSAVVTGTYKKVKWTYKIKVQVPRLSATSVTMTRNSSKQLKLTGTTLKASWTSNSPSVVSVSSSGKITAKKTGSTVITAKVNGMKYHCTVLVKGASIPRIDYVWICDTGKKYHTNPYCSKMNNPYKVTKQEAERLDYDACKKCYR